MGGYPPADPGGSRIPLIMGLDRPDTGHARIGGRAYRDLPWPLREVGGLLQSRPQGSGNGAHPGRCADQHLLALAASHGIPRRRIDEVLGMVGLTDARRQRAGQLSLGMARRLGIAAALLGDPGVLILDEPVNGLDPEGIRWIRTLLKSLAAEGRTVFVSSHLIGEMALTAERLVVIGQGRLLAQIAACLRSSARSGPNACGRPRTMRFCRKASLRWPAWLPPMSG